jgi:peptidoglycan/xylan/chitin deacetylase (PgdA/CDA1 family)
MRSAFAVLGTLLLAFSLVAVAPSAADAAGHAGCPSGLLALTFDDGPDEHTGAVLDTLAAHDAPAPSSSGGPRSKAGRASSRG